MNQDLIHTCILAAIFLAVFAVAEILYRYLKIAAEYTRKFVHIVSGLITLSFPILISNAWYVLFLCASFALILLLSIRFKLLPSINAVGRQTAGSFIYPAAVYGCFLAFQYQQNYIYFYLPVLLLALCDPIAAIIGKNVKSRRYTIGGEQKSLGGSLAFFISAIAIAFSFLLSVSHLQAMEALVDAVIIALFGTLAEGLSRKGIDNITVPGIALVALRFILKI